MWSLVVVVFHEFPVERESRVFLVVGSEPSFDLSECCGFADSAEDVFDLLLVTVCVERGFSSSYAPELAAMVGEDFSWFRVFVDGWFLAAFVDG